MLKFLRLIMLFLTVACSQVTIAQVHAENPNAEHDRFMELYQASTYARVPDSVRIILKDYAVFNQLDEPTVMKNELPLKILFNPAVALKDKYFSVLYLERIYDHKDSGIPILFIRNMKKRLKDQLESSTN